VGDVSYREQIQIPGQRRPLQLPWPMTTREAIWWVAMISTGMAATLVVVVWLSFLFIEPSLWRLMPAIIWILCVKYLIVPAIVRLCAPKNIHERWTVMWELQRLDAAATQLPYKISGHEFNNVWIHCPFCTQDVKASVWNITGKSKCPCGAIFNHKTRTAAKQQEGVD